MKVVFVKLLTGEEIIAKMVSESDYTLGLADPMSLEYGESADGRRTIYLSRYNPFNVDAKLVVHQTALVYAPVPVIQELVEYYQKSLDYVRTRSDINFVNSIKVASDYLDRINKGDGAADQLFDYMDEVDNEVPSSNTTYH